MSMNALMNAAPLASTPPTAPANSSATPAAPNLAASLGRRIEGDAMIFIPAAGLGREQHDKIGFDRTGPSTTLSATVTRQKDGTWLTKIDVPYGEQLGGNRSGETDLTTTMCIPSRDQPTIGARGELSINGQTIDGNRLERYLGDAKLRLPDYTEFRYGGPED